MAAWKPGQSGNPAGPKPGTLHKLTVLTRKLVADKGPAIVRSILKDAKDGDRNAQQLFLRHLWPRSKALDCIQFEVPKLDSAADVPSAIRSVFAAMAEGRLTPVDASAAVTVLKTYAEACVLQGHEERLAAVERRLGLVNTKDIVDIGGNGHDAGGMATPH
jgi:hypothetical protein